MLQSSARARRAVACGALLLSAATARAQPGGDAAVIGVRLSAEQCDTVLRHTPADPAARGVGDPVTVRLLEAARGVPRDRPESGSSGVGAVAPDRGSAGGVPGAPRAGRDAAAADSALVREARSQCRALRDERTARGFAERVERSYIGSGSIGGNLHDLVFEATISPHLFLARSRRWAVVATPKVVLRMMTDDSKPVRTPSYMPRATTYWSPRRDPTYERLDLISFTVGHHSNGAEGAATDSAGHVVTDTRQGTPGSFSTNYLELAFDRSRSVRPAGPARPRWRPRRYGYRVGLEFHPQDGSLSTARELRPHYAATRLNLGAGATFSDRVWLSSAGVALLGPQTGAEGARRMSGGATLFYRPGVAWLRSGNLVITTTGYNGSDYYNLQFPRRITYWRLGVCIIPIAAEAASTTIFQTR